MIVIYEVIDREHMGGTLTLGDNVSIGRGVSIDISADVSIADGAIVSEQALLLTHDHVPGDMTSVVASPLRIEAGAWVGARSIVLSSCNRIGYGSVIGAGSVVTRDVGDHELWAGNPARFIRRID